MKEEVKTRLRQAQKKIANGCLDDSLAAILSGSMPKEDVNKKVNSWR